MIFAIKPRLLAVHGAWRFRSVLGLTMKPPEFAKSGIETCIVAFQIWGAFFFITAVAEIAFPESAHTWLVVFVAGILALIAICYRWTAKVEARRELANLSLLAVAILITFDVWAALTD